MNRYRIGLGVVAALIVGAVLVTTIRNPAPPSTGSNGLLAVNQRTQAPEFTGLDGWLNSTPLTLRELRGKVVLIDFWTFSCVNCVRTIPHLQVLDQAYQSKGLVIVGVHSPEFDFEKVPANVAAAVKRLGVTWPVAIDSQMATWNAYQNQYWPAEYLIDKQGRIAYTSFGEGDYEATAAAVASLLGIKQVALPSATPIPSDITPELYAGSERGQLANGEAYGALGQATNYPDPGPPSPQNSIQIVGRWSDYGQYLEADGPGQVRLEFLADTVYLVAGTAGGILQVGVKLDGQLVQADTYGSALSKAGILIDRQDLYQVLKGVGSGYHLIDLSVPKGFRIYTFTFG